MSPSCVQVLVPPHQPQPAAVQSSHVVAAGHGHSLATHAQSDAHVPLVGPSVSPFMHAEVAPHHPQPGVGVQSPHVVNEAQSAGEMVLSVPPPPSVPVEPESIRAPPSVGGGGEVESSPPHPLAASSVKASTVDQPMSPVARISSLSCPKGRIRSTAKPTPRRTTRPWGRRSYR